MSSLPDDEWTVWGDAREPVFSGTEESAKEFAESARPNHDLYLQNEKGEEWIFEGGKWVQV